jgi:AraC-like DNA-binding protein
MRYAQMTDPKETRISARALSRHIDRCRPHVLVLATLGDQQSCMLRRLKTDYDLIIAQCGAEIIASVMAAPDVAAVLTDLWDAQGHAVAPILKAIRNAFPAIPVIVCCRLAPESASELLEVARAGINALACRGFDDINAKLASILLKARNDCDAMRVLAALRPYLRENEVPVVEYCITHARQRISVSEVAAALSLSRRTLSYRLATGRLLSAHSLIVWCRLLTAARLLQDSGRTVESVALSLQFGSAAAFRNMLRRQAGLTPVDLRASGGQDFLLRAFTRLLAARERTGESPSRPLRGRCLVHKRETISIDSLSLPTSV